MAFKYAKIGPFILEKLLPMIFKSGLVKKWNGKILVYHFF